jgi:hypothetical protein
LERTPQATPGEEAVQDRPFVQGLHTGLIRPLKALLSKKVALTAAAISVVSIAAAGRDVSAVTNLTASATRYLSRPMRSALAGMSACLVLAAGCGGDGGGDGDPDAFRAEANSICTEYEEKIAAIPAPQEALDEWAAIAADVGDLLETGINELDALEPPGDLGEGYDEWVELKRESLSATRELQEAGAAADEELVSEALARIERSESRADELAAELGLDECATSLSDR